MQLSQIIKGWNVSRSVFFRATFSAVAFLIQESEMGGAEVMSDEAPAPPKTPPHTLRLAQRIPKIPPENVVKTHDDSRS